MVRCPLLAALVDWVVVLAGSEVLCPLLQRAAWAVVLVVLEALSPLDFLASAALLGPDLVLVVLAVWEAAPCPLLAQDLAWVVCLVSEA